MSDAPQSPRRPNRERDAVIMMRSRRAWQDAVKEAADFDRAPSMTDFIDRAVASYCKAIGFPKPIPRR